MRAATSPLPLYTSLAGMHVTLPFLPYCSTMLMVTLACVTLSQSSCMGQHAVCYSQKCSAKETLRRKTECGF